MSRRHSYLAIVCTIALVAPGIVAAQPPADPPVALPSASSPVTLPPTIPEAPKTTADSLPIPPGMAVAQPPANPPVTSPTGPDATPAPTPVDGCGPAENIIERLGTYYKNGFVLMESSDPERIPFKLVFNNFAQMRFTNTQLDSLTYTDHLGGVRRVDPRNDISYNRDMLLFSGYVFDPSLKYNFGLWASGSLASVVGVGAITYEFSKAFSLNAGYSGLPGSRSLLGGYKDLAGNDRSMADSFFRPGFTQGIWASGEPLEDLYYNFMVGNSLNTLNINAGKIDANLTYSGSVWWEPLGSYGPGQAYNDLEKHSTPVIRVGSCYTHSREDRFSDASANSPDNIQIYNSDGVLFFSTGALAPGVTVQLTNYDMLAVDAGFKYSGLSLNGQYFFRYLSNFRADGPLPVHSTFDHGFEASAGYFFFKKLEFYYRMSMVFGQFGDAQEYCGGFNWYPLGNRGLRVCGEAGRINNSPVGNIITEYQAGQSGMMYVLQAQVTF